MAKVSKSSVSYTDSGSKTEHCSICRHYIMTNTCDVVLGRVVPKGWCERFEKKANDK